MAEPPSNPPKTTQSTSTRNPVPPPHPAYLPPPTSNSNSSPLLIDQTLYTSIQIAQRIPLYSHTLPPRSGHAWTAPAKSIVRISTPQGAQVGDLNIWNFHNPRERFWASRTRQLHASHLTRGDRLWSCLPFMRPLLTIIEDTLGPRYGVDGVDEHGGRVHDLLGTRCDPYINQVLSEPVTSGDDAGAMDGKTGGEVSGEVGYDFHCHSNLTRAILPFGLTEYDVHDVINLFQVTGLDEKGRYCMSACPATSEDYIEFFCEQDVLLALSTCPGGDLSKWGFGSDSEKEMRECCRPLGIEVWTLADEEGVLGGGKWKEPKRAGYKGIHGIKVPEGEGMGPYGG